MLNQHFCVALCSQEVERRSWRLGHAVIRVDRDRWINLSFTSHCYMMSGEDFE